MGIKRSARARSPKCAAVVGHEAFVRAPCLVLAAKFGEDRRLEGLGEERNGAAATDARRGGLERVDELIQAPLVHPDHEQLRRKPAEGIGLARLLARRKPGEGEPFCLG